MNTFDLHLGYQTVDNGILLYIHLLLNFPALCFNRLNLGRFLSSIANIHRFLHRLFIFKNKTILIKYIHNFILLTGLKMYV